MATFDAGGLQEGCDLQLKASQENEPWKGAGGCKAPWWEIFTNFLQGCWLFKIRSIVFLLEFRSNQFQIKATKIENTVKAEQKAKLLYIIEDSTLTRDMPGCLREDLELHFQPASGCFTVVVIKGLASVCPTDTIAARGATRHCNDMRPACLLFPCGSSIR